MKDQYPLWQRIFGPVITQDDMLDIQFRAFNEGWSDWLDMIMEMRNKRNRDWLLAYIRDGYIFIETREYIDSEAYYDPDPFEQD